MQSTPVLVTGEAVAVDLRYARAGSRTIAALLDFAAELVAFGLLAALPLGLLVPAGDQVLAGSIGTVAFIAIFLGYPVTMETLTRGRTLGKLALGLRVLRDDGGPVRFRHCLVRGLVGLFVEKPGVTLGVAGLVSCVVNGQAKRLGDLTAGTVVVQERVPAAEALAVSMPPELASWAATLDLTGLPAGLLLACRQYLVRSPRLTAGARQRIGERLAGEIAQHTTPAPPEQTAPDDYLMAVLAERRNRSSPASHASTTGPGRSAARSEPAPDIPEGGFAAPH